MRNADFGINKRTVERVKDKPMRCLVFSLDENKKKHRSWIRELRVSFEKELIHCYA
jgi:hypothetical protein